MMRNLLSTFCLSCMVAQAACSGSSPYDPMESVVLQAGNGAEVEFQTNTEQGAVTGVFTKQTDPALEPSDDMLDVSGEYLLEVEGNVQGDLVVTLPVNDLMLPTGWSPGSLMAESQDPDTFEWTSAGGLAWYDGDQGTLTFDVEGPPTVPAVLSSGLQGAASSALTAQSHKGKYRVRHVYFTKGVEATTPGSKFVVRYYPPLLHGKHSVPTDAAWNSTTGNAVDPDVPDFVEDLHAALNLAYDNLLTILDSNGKLFQPLSVNQRTVWVHQLKSAGESFIGGPMKMSSDRISSWAGMKAVAGHELTHVFQGQYYTGGLSGNVLNWVFRLNKWFIEATANFYGSLAADLTGAERATAYGVDESPSYLSVGLTASDKFAYYAAAHFLEWVTVNHGTKVVADAMSEDSNSIALVTLNRAIRAADEEAGLGTAFENYGKDLASRPQDHEGMNGSVAALLFTYMNTLNLLPTVNRLDENTTYLPVKRTLPKLGAAWVELHVSSVRPSLLVIDAVPPASSSIETFTWDVISGSNAAFEGKTPLEDFSGQAITVKNCGKGLACTGFTQVILNTSFTTWDPLDFAYYILVTPFVFQPAMGEVQFTTTDVGNLPAAFIDEFRVYRQTEAGGYEQLGSVPYDEGNPLVTFKDGRIKVSDVVVVQVVDRNGHRWPEVEEGESEGVFIGCRTVGDDAEYHWGCLPYVGDPASPEFAGNATLQCLNAGYKQYYGVSFTSEQKCRDWCRQTAAENSTGLGNPVCDTP